MDIDYAPEDQAFREEVRTFIAENKPKVVAEKRSKGESLTREDYLAWHKACYEKGWAAPKWPVEHGGTGWTVTQKYIWGEECSKAEVIPPLPFGMSMLAPVIMAYGNDKQKAEVLPKILSGDVWWCQGYSEPGSGSDLASLKTRAVLEGDHYVVNGQKTWTTLAQYADWIFCLVRTDPDVKKQMGITFLLIDMKTPGITVNPIITMEGGHEVNEVFLDNVKVPVENRVGNENEGWTYAKFLLSHERSGIAGVSSSKNAITKLKEIARTEMSDGHSLWDDASFRNNISDISIQLTALEYTELRTLAAESVGKGPGPESSLLKIRGTEIAQRIDELVVEATGYYALPFRGGPSVDSNIFPVGPDYAAEASPTYLNDRKTSIFGGSNEIQRNIMAKAVLGL
jgi:alkylation response protein AidB-like acyl-CoA dehydrogenase